MFAIYKREITSYFTTPIGYVFSAFFLIVSGALFAMTTLLMQENSNIAEYFTYLLAVFAILLPLLTMKLFSEDKKTKTEQVILTSPVSIIGMVLGKYLAAVTIFLTTFVLNSLNFILLFDYGTPNKAVIISNIFGMFCIGLAFLAIGLFLSAITENQMIAAIATIGTLVFCIVTTFIADSITTDWVRVVIKWFSVLSRYAAFARGMLDINAIIYFISFAAVFLVMTVLVYDKRRWM